MTLWHKYSSVYIAEKVFKVKVIACPMHGSLHFDDVVSTFRTTCLTVGQN